MRASTLAEAPADPDVMLELSNITCKWPDIANKHTGNTAAGNAPPPTGPTAAPGKQDGSVHDATVASDGNPVTKDASCEQSPCLNGINLTVRRGEVSFQSPALAVHHRP